MEENKTESTEGKKRNVSEVAVTSQKIGLMTRFNLLLVLIPLIIWTAVRYWKGGFPPVQIALYVLFLAAVLIGSRFLCSFYAEYDHDTHLLIIGQHLFRLASITIDVARLASAEERTVEITEKTIQVDGFKRRAQGTYTVYHLAEENDGNEAGASGDLWLERQDDARKFDAMLMSALSECGKESLFTRHDGAMTWQEYQRMYSEEESEA